jgi:hypothetical protein
MEVMRPFEGDTKIVECETYLTLSSVIPVLEILRNKTTGEFHNQGDNVERNYY